MLLFDSSKHTLKRIESLKELIKLVQGRFPLHEGTVDDKRLEANGNRCKYEMSAIQFANRDLLICVVYNTWPLSEVTPDQGLGVDYWYATYPTVESSVKELPPGQYDVEVKRITTVEHRDSGKRTIHMDLSILPENTDE